VFGVESRKFSCKPHLLQSLFTAPCFLPPVRLTLMLTPRVLGTCCVLLLQVLCRMKKWIGGVKRVFTSGPSSRGSSSRSGNGSQDSTRSSSFMPSPHETGGSICYPAHDNVPMATDSDDISIHITVEMEKYESIHHREFAHTCIGVHNPTLEYVSTANISITPPSP
jgi:hypothetical protein